MLKDFYGAPLSTGNHDAVAAFDSASALFLRHCAGAPEQLSVAKQADGEFIAADALEGLGSVILARSETMELARNLSLSATRALAKRTATAFEQTLVGALEQSSQGQMSRAASILENGIDADAPHPLLIKIAHMFRFMAGDISGMLSLTAPYADRSDAVGDGQGFILGCHAFALEEAGQLEMAESTAQLALHLEPHDVWGMHALAHVYEVSNRTGEGVLWVESGRQHWSMCNNFSRHMAWHLALFHLDRGNYDKVLNLYDMDLMLDGSEDFRDVANAVSLLMRLRQMGAGVGDRFEALRAIAERRKADVTYVFASLHHLLTLLECGDFYSAEAVVAALDALAKSNQGDQSRVAEQIGLPLAHALVAFARGKQHIAGLAELVKNLPALGGSYVQRDLFLRSAIIMADDVCDHSSTSALLRIRSLMLREDGFARMIEQRRCFGGGTEIPRNVA